MLELIALSMLTRISLSSQFNTSNNGNADAVHVYTEIPEYDKYTEQEFLELSGQTIDSFDFLSDYSNLRYLSIINCDIVDGLVLPKIDTLQRLTVFDPKALEIITNNTQLAGKLEIGSGYMLHDDDEREGLTPLSNLAGLEAFSSLEVLIVGDPVNDISALSGCVNLRWLDLFYCTSINTLKPLSDRSEVIQVIKHPAYMGAISTATRRKCNPYSQKTILIPFEDQEIIYDCHEAIVTRDLWEKANALLVEIGHKMCGYKQEEKGIYYGLLFCAHCGKMLESQRHNNYMYIFCRCWPPDIGMSSRGVTTKNISRHLIAEIRKMALMCENDENSAYSFIHDHISSERDKTRVEIEIDINAARKRIEILKDKITNFEKYTSNKSLQQKEKDTIYGALCATLKDEEHKVEELKKSDNVIPSGSDLYQFIRIARRYGYVQSIERSVMDELVDRIYITKKMNQTNNQQDRILVKYKHVGLLNGIYRSRTFDDKRN